MLACTGHVARVGLLSRSLCHLAVAGGCAVNARVKEPQEKRQHRQRCSMPGKCSRSKTFDNFIRARQPKAYLKAVKFAHDPQGNLVFHGGYGTGKTHLAAAICAALRDKGIASLFASATKLFAAYSDKMNNHEDHWSIIKQAISSPVFVLDDVDKARHTPAREEMFSLIFDERAKTRRPMVLSTNKLDDLAAYIGAANASRLMIGLEVAEMVGRDYREEM